MCIHVAKADSLQMYVSRLVILELVLEVRPEASQCPRKGSEGAAGRMNNRLEPLTGAARLFPEAQIVDHVEKCISPEIILSENCIFHLTRVRSRATSKLSSVSPATSHQNCLGGFESFDCLWSAAMEKALPPCLSATDWKVLYRAAIYETDRSLTSQKVAEAERAAHARERELFYSGGTLEEKEALEDALYALRAMKSAFQYAQAA